MPLTRRTLLQAFASGTFFLTAAPRGAQEVTTAELSTVGFPQGVASGDPQPDSVVLWTRAQPDDSPSQVRVLLELSEDPDFSDTLLLQVLATGEDSDFTLRAHIDGLAPDRWYYYRFSGAGGSRSTTGRTRTAPAEGQDRHVKLAFASCQSFEQGYYGAWARMLADDIAAPESEQIQFVLHLGDFIYERSWPARADGSKLSRTLPPFPDGVDTGRNRHAVSLADYRMLYRTYLSDPHLQAARARWPFVCTWDDHEFSNDNFQSYSTYGEGHQLEAARKQDANQAWFEFIPAALDELAESPAHGFRRSALTGAAEADNLVARDSLSIYRKLRWGRHLDLLLTDNRSYRSPHCLPEGLAESMGLPMNTASMVEIADAGRSYGGGNPPEFLPQGDGTSPNPGRNREPGSILGAGQREWFLDSLEQSTATWKLWGNSLPLVPLRVDLSTLPFTDFEDSVLSIDAWAGFPHEVDHLMRQVRARGVGGLVSLSGDHHMHGAGTISWSVTEEDAQAVAVDFTIAGISSTPLFEEIAVVARDSSSEFQAMVFEDTEQGQVPVWNMTMLQGVLASLAYSRTGMETVSGWLGPNEANPGLAYVDTDANGYGLVSLDGTELQVRMVTMAETRQPFDRAPPIRHVAEFRLQSWEGGDSPELRGPEFVYDAPFPFTAPAV